MKILKKISPADYVTLTHGALGFLAILFVIDGGEKTDYALTLIAIAVILDGVDGRVARRYGSKHGFGHNLDSVADTFSFCFAPSLLLYRLLYIQGKTSFTSLENFLVVLAAFLVAGFGTLRLARYIGSDHLKAHFVGLPTPAAAMFFVALLHPDLPLREMPYVIPVIAIFVSLLMLSEISYPRLDDRMSMVGLVAVIVLILSLVLPNISGYIDPTLVAIIPLILVLFFIAYGPRWLSSQGGVKE